MTPLDYANRLRRRAEQFRARPVPDQTPEAIAELRSQNEQDWSVIRASDNLRLSVCKELLKPSPGWYWDLGRLQ